MPKVYNRRDKEIPKDAVYVGRPTKWGNPFKIGTSIGREEVVKLYAEKLSELDKQNIIRELRGKDLICWCAPEACHADVLLEIANS